MNKAGRSPDPETGKHLKTFSGTNTHLKPLPWGKKLNHSLYITEESLQLVDLGLYKFIADLKTRAEAGTEYNVVKFFTNEFKISWLSYPDRVERKRVVEDLLILFPPPLLIK